MRVIFALLVLFSSQNLFARSLFDIAWDKFNTLDGTMNDLEYEIQNHVFTCQAVSSGQNAWTASDVQITLNYEGDELLGWHPIFNLSKYSDVKEAKTRNSVLRKVETELTLMNRDEAQVEFAIDYQPDKTVIFVRDYLKHLLNADLCEDYEVSEFCKDYEPYMNIYACVIK